MRSVRHIAFMTFFMVCFSLSAQNYKAGRLKQAVDAVKLQITSEALSPEQTTMLTAGDGQVICLRTSPTGEIEHVGIPLFADVMRLLQPSPVYDFLEYAVLNWKYKVMDNRLYLSKVIFRKGDWTMLLRGRLNECDCSIENKENKLYIIRWSRNNQEVAEVGVPIEYELLNNDTRRNMERAFVNDLLSFKSDSVRPQSVLVNERELSVYGTEGLFVAPGQSYIVDILNQNIYYKLTTVFENVDTVIWNKPITMRVETVLPVVVNDPDYPSETFANLLMCDDSSVPEATLDLDFHLSDYHRQHVTMTWTQLKKFCRQHGCRFFFACDGRDKDQLRGVLFASNLQKGYNHLFSLRASITQLTSSLPSIHGDVYLYIPPVDKEKLFGTVPEKKSGAKFKLP